MSLWARGRLCQLAQADASDHRSSLHPRWAVPQLSREGARAVPGVGRPVPRDSESRNACARARARTCASRYPQDDPSWMSEDADCTPSPPSSVRRPGRARSLFLAAACVVAWTLTMQPCSRRRGVCGSEEGCTHKSEILRSLGRETYVVQGRSGGTSDAHEEATQLCSRTAVLLLQSFRSGAFL